MGSVFRFFSLFFTWQTKGRKEMINGKLEMAKGLAPKKNFYLTGWANSKCIFPSGVQKHFHFLLLSLTQMPWSMAQFPRVCLP